MGRVDAVFLLSIGAYSIKRLFPGCDWATEIRDALDQAGDAGIRYAQDLVERLGGIETLAARVGMVQAANLAPLLRVVQASGRPIPPRLHNLIQWTAANRSVLAALSPEERALAVAKVTAHWGAPNLEMEMENLEALADLLVTPELLAHLRTIIEGDEELESLYAARLDVLEQRMRAGWT